MARKNRVTVPNGIYHVTSRICNKAMLFKADAVKEKIQKWIFDIAYFSGVEIYAWCIMDNHLHLLVHVPLVPRRLWTDPSREPASWAFGMRPPECYPPLWQEESSFCLAGDSPHGGCSLRMLSRPNVDFMLEDGEMLSRLARLYSKRAADEIGARWESLRSRNRNIEVELEKVRYCRRMYNISQFVKTLKERIAMRYNAEFEHEGCLWQGRFYSGVVENTRAVLSVVAGYIDYNPVKAKLVSSPGLWKYSSWSVALGEGPASNVSRQMYCKMLGCKWLTAKSIMESVFADDLPDGVSPEEVKAQYDNYDEEVDQVACACEEDRDGKVHAPAYRASQAIRCDMWFFRKGYYIGRTVGFAYDAVKHLPLGFPRANMKSIKRCRAFIWDGTPIVGCGGALAA